MQAGLLRERITINSIAETNTAGSLSETATEHAQRWARVEPMGGGESWLEQAAQRQTRQPYRVTIRHLSTVTPQMEIVWGSKTLEIDAVRHDEKSRFTVLDCFERPA